MNVVVVTCMIVCQVLLLYFYHLLLLLKFPPFSCHCLFYLCCSFLRFVVLSFFCRVSAHHFDIFLVSYVTNLRFNVYLSFQVYFRLCFLFSFSIMLSFLSFFFFFVFTWRHFFIYVVFRVTCRFIMFLFFIFPFNLSSS